MKKKWGGNLLSILGLLLLCAAIALTSYNLWDEQRAQWMAEEEVRKLDEYREENRKKDIEGIGMENESAEEIIPEYLRDPMMPMPEVTLDGVNYIGTMEIPVLGLKLPVISEWSYAGLRISPCRYTGSVYLNNMVVAAHNYERHFGEIDELSLEDWVIFTDMDDNRFFYQVEEKEVLQPTEVIRMSSSEYDLTLFTCVPSGQARYSVRCRQVK